MKKMKEWNFNMILVIIRDLIILEKIFEDKNMIARKYRNRRIGEFLKELKLTEGRNTGIPKIKRALKNNGSKEPEFETNETRDYFITTIFMHDGFENEIKKQFFPKDNIIIKIYEKFILSGQYNPEKLMYVYKDSILMELKECEHVLYTMFKQADTQFPDNDTMELTLEDSVIAKSKEDELVRILDKVLNER